MQKNNYTHIPIIEHDVVVGVFSENTVLSYLIDDEIIEIGDDVCFTALGKYLPIENHSSESFRFISRNASLQNVNELFEKALRSQDRIGLVFVTQNGKPSEKLLGIISAWDAAAKE